MASLIKPRRHGWAWCSPVHCCKRSTVSPPVHSKCMRCFRSPIHLSPWSRGQALQCCRQLIVILIFAFVLVILILWIGMEVEQSHVRKEPGTVSFYDSPHVCALENVPGSVVWGMRRNATLVPAQSISSSSLRMTSVTFPNISMAENSNIVNTNSSSSTNSSTNDVIIMHCGDCGQCSNPHDILIYDNTKTTLFDSTLNCAKRGAFGGARAASDCMQKFVGFTSGCNKCWVDNIVCDLKKCIFSCFFHAIFSSGVATDGISQPLNRCTNCDEVRCGPAFLTCAGANRRQCGILTDLERNASVEVCQKVTPPQWWQNAELQVLWKRQQEQRQ